MDPDTFPGAPEISGVCGFHNPNDADEFSWPEQAGAASYRVARSTDLQFGGNCLLKSRFATAWIDIEPVPEGVCHHYLVRTFFPSAGSWGADSDGVERTGVCP